MSNEKMEESWMPELGEFVRVMHDAGYRQVPPFEHDHDDDCWEGTEGPIHAVDGEDGTAVVYCFRRDAEGSFPIADLTPLDHLKRPEGAVDGAWVQIETGKYDGKLAQIRGWRRGRLHIQRADGPVEAYRPEEVMLVGDPGVDMDVSRATPPVGLRGGEPSAEK